MTLSPEPDSDWPYRDIYPSLMAGDLLKTYQWFFERGQSLCVMPIDRLIVGRVTTFPSGIVIYPKGFLNLGQLRIAPNSSSSSDLSERQSEASGIRQDVMERYPLVVLPVPVNWAEFRGQTHAKHLHWIRYFSESIDRNAMDFCRFRQCRLDNVEDLPCRAGQVPSTNPMMAGMAIYSPAAAEGRVVGGAAFTHCITKGLGMPLSQPEWDGMPRRGEVGEIARRGLAIYTQMLESNSETSRYVQAMTLFEFQAYPDRYEDFHKVTQVILPYLSEDRTPERDRLANRFQHLSSGERRVDPTQKKPNGKPVIVKGRGYRQQIVHEGKRLEELVGDDARITLFRELDSYLRPVLQHMIMFSEEDFDDYQNVREHAFRHLQSPNESASRLFEPLDGEEIPF